jgi:hypothetical protein
MSDRRPSLLCDGESESLPALRAVLHGAGFEVTATRTAADALDRAALGARSTRAGLRCPGFAAPICTALHVSSRYPGGSGLPAATVAVVPGWSRCCLSWWRDFTPSLRNALRRW